MPKHHKNKMKSVGSKSSPQHKKTSAVDKKTSASKGQPAKKSPSVGTSGKKKSAYIQTGPQVKKRTKWKPLNVHLAGLKKPEAAAQ